jgi:hypothetical protein
MPSDGKSSLCLWQGELIIIIIRNGAKTISIQTLFGRLNNNKKRSKNNKSPKHYLGDLITSILLHVFHSLKFVNNGRTILE